MNWGPIWKRTRPPGTHHHRLNPYQPNMGFESEPPGGGFFVIRVYVIEREREEKVFFFTFAFPSIPRFRLQVKGSNEPEWLL
jgi:hypothetical protein